MKRVIAILLSFITLAMALTGADFVLKDRTDHGVKQCIAVYKQPKDSIDVVVLGSSHVHFGVNTAKLWEEYGISAFDYSSAEQPLWVSYYYLREICKRQHPKVVVLDLFAPAAILDGFKFTYTHLAESFNGYKLCRNKLNMVDVCLDDKTELWNKYFPGFVGYHDRYDQLTGQDFKNLTYDYTNYKGFTPNFAMTSVPEPSVYTEDILPPSDKSVEYLQKIVDYTRDNGIQLYLTIIPYQVNHERANGLVQEEIERYNWVEQYVNGLKEAGDDHVFYDYTLTHLGDIGIDFEGGSDIFDESHLNYYGATKFSNYLGMHLKYIYGGDVLPDHRGDPYYASWDVHVEEIKAVVEENSYEWR